MSIAENAISLAEIIVGNTLNSTCDNCYPCLPEIIVVNTLYHTFSNWYPCLS